MPMILMSADEAVLHFKKWLSDETTISCVGNLHGFAFSMTGKFTEASLELVKFTGTGVHSGLSLSPQSDAIGFAFADPRDLVKEQAGIGPVPASSSLAVLLTRRLPAPDEASEGVLFVEFS